MAEVGKTVGRFEILREVGRGGMAIVYLARQTDLRRDVALKELGAFHLADQAFASRFERESQLAGSLNHPNIVTVHDYFVHDRVPYIAMEYVPRGSLRPRVGGLTLAQILGVLDDVLAGLAHAHERGVVHRDLKPENLMVTADGRIKIADFGIAKALDPAAGGRVTATGLAVGTPAYMAPEQALTSEIGPWTDLYSTGVIAYELLLGRVPFPEAETPVEILMHHVNDPIPSPRALDPDLDPRLAEWTEGLLAKTAAERPRSAAEAGDALEEIALERLGPRWKREARLRDGDGPPRPPKAAPTVQVDEPPLVKRPGRRRWAWIAVPLAVAGLAAAAIGVFQAGGPASDDRLGAPTAPSVESAPPRLGATRAPPTTSPSSTEPEIARSTTHRAAIEALVDAWRGDDRSAALAVADDGVVDELFRVPFPDPAPRLEDCLGVGTGQFDCTYEYDFQRRFVTFRAVKSGDVFRVLELRFGRV